MTGKVLFWLCGVMMVAIAFLWSFEIPPAHADWTSPLTFQNNDWEWATTTVPGWALKANASGLTCKNSAGFCIQNSMSSSQASTTRQILWPATWTSHLSYWHIISNSAGQTCGAKQALGWIDGNGTLTQLSYQTGTTTVGVTDSAWPNTTTTGIYSTVSNTTGICNAQIDNIFAENTSTAPVINTTSTVNTTSTEIFHISTSSSVQYFSCLGYSSSTGLCTSTTTIGSTSTFPDNMYVTSTIVNPELQISTFGVVVLIFLLSFIAFVLVWKR